MTASAQHFAGVLALGRDEIEAARSRFDAALRALNSVPNNAPPFLIAMSLGWAVDERRDPPFLFRRDCAVRSSGWCAAGGWTLRLAMALGERIAGNLRAAFVLIDDAYARFRDVDDRYGEAYALSQRGHALRG